jgi:hypothetical protein
MFAMGSRHLVNIPIVQSSVEYAMNTCIDIAWTQVATHPHTRYGNCTERKQQLRIMILMRTLPLTKLVEELRLLHLRFSDLFEMMSFADQHKQSLPSGTLLTFRKPVGATQYDANTFSLTLTVKKGLRPSMKLSQAAQSTRKVDNALLVNAGSIILATEAD